MVKKYHWTVSGMASEGFSNPTRLDLFIEEADYNQLRQEKDAYEAEAEQYLKQAEEATAQLVKVKSERDALTATVERRDKTIDNNRTRENDLRHERAALASANSDLQYERDALLVMVSMAQEGHPADCKCSFCKSVEAYCAVFGKAKRKE